MVIYSSSAQRQAGRDAFNAADGRTRAGAPPCPNLPIQLAKTDWIIGWNQAKEKAQQDCVTAEIGL